MSTFPELRGEATTGKTKVWSIRVSDQDGVGVIETTHGYLDGKMQVTEKRITDGKNLGKKNATTAVQQAVSEARAAWTKKKESGYAEATAAVSDAADAMEDIDLAESSGRGKGIDESAPLPMLAHEYTKRGKGNVFPCFTQPKLDGTRCVGMVQQGLFSRNRKTYPHLEHIRAELDQLPAGLVLDGELYSTTLTFQEIVGLVKRETLKKGDQEKQLQIQYFVYDVINGDTCEQRQRLLQSLVASRRFKYLVLVPTMNCNSEEEMKEQHAMHVAAGYEGIMLRTKTGLYKNSRSVDLLKYKEFFDGEYKIVGFEQGQGLEEGCVIWACITPEGGTFACRPRGTREERQELFLKGASYIGKMLTVRYQELTSSEQKVPRFPVGIAIRDYE